MHGRHTVFFLVFRVGIEKSVGDASVVGEDYESVRVLVESADREDTAEAGDARDVGFAFLRRMGDDVPRLVVREVPIRLLLSAHLHGVGGGDLLTDNGARAVDRYEAPFNELVGTTARSVAFLGEVLVDTNGDVHPHIRH